MRLANFLQLILDIFEATMTLEVVYKYVVKLIALSPNCLNLTIDGSTVHQINLSFIIRNK